MFNSFRQSSEILVFPWEKRTDVFPYIYRYSVSINYDDKHVGTDGWSHSCNLHDPENRAMTIAGLSFLDLCPGTDRDRLFFLRQEFPGAMEGYYNLQNRAKTFGVSHYLNKNKCVFTIVLFMIEFYVTQLVMTRRCRVKLTEQKLPDRSGFAFSKQALKEVKGVKKFSCL